VHSRVTRWKPRAASPNAEGERRLRRCLAVCFAGRRKTVRNNLRTALGGDEPAEALLAAAGVDGGCRAQELPPETFVALAERWPAD
jgi:16S rRNA A1518/A1519 N6-dimethyltransferase RsmA/KsgA/DIM1 with predicted DNA glycosylase/AP lyase activity